MDLIDRIDRWGQLAPDRLAHISGDQSLTYRELIRHSDVLAAHGTKNSPLTWFRANLFFLKDS